MRKTTKTIRYSVGINDAQESLLRELMGEDMIGDVSTYFGFMLLEIRRVRAEVGTKRGPGRPKKEQEDDENEDDNVLKYQAPDYPRNKTMYSYNDLKNDWYPFDHKRGVMPPRN